MSSFMCCPETIGNIASYMTTLALRNGEDGRHDVSRLFYDLYDMNVEALTTRYSAETVNDMIGDFKQYEESWLSLYCYANVRPSFPLAQMFRCYLYQCSESYIPTRKLYKFVELCFNNVCLHLMVDYTHTEWTPDPCKTVMEMIDKHNVLVDPLKYWR